MSTTCRVSSAISPADSASSMNASGYSSPRVGCCQRTSASTPSIAPVAAPAWAGSAAPARPAASAAPQLGDVLQPVPAVTVAGLVVDGHARPGRPSPSTSRGRRAGAAPPRSPECPGPRATPTLASTARSMPPTANGRRSWVRSRSASRAASVRVDVDGQDDELVAAEAGEQVPAPAAARASRGPTCRSSASPTTWPRESLISLNRSRSSTRTATLPPPRPAGPSAASSASNTDAPVGQAGQLVGARLPAAVGQGLHLAEGQRGARQRRQHGAQGQHPATGSPGRAVARQQQDHRGERADRRDDQRTACRPRRRSPPGRGYWQAAMPKQRKATPQPASSGPPTV